MFKRDFVAGYKAARGDLFQKYQLEEFLGNPEHFYVDDIIDEVTHIDYSDGNRYWNAGIDTYYLNDVCSRHEKWTDDLSSGWEGEGWYYVCWSDGMTERDWVWIETEHDFREQMKSLDYWASEYHLPYLERVDDDEVEDWW